ncbi:coiled-coil domain-containing protein 27 [Rhynchocyon petersi]
MPFKKESKVSKKGDKTLNVAPNTFMKGLANLQSIASRDARSPELELLHNQRSLTRSAGLVSCHHQQTGESRDFSNSVHPGFASQMEGIRKMFLMRPSCPQFCSRATSMSQYGIALASLPKKLDVSTETWGLMEDGISGQQDADTSMDDYLLPSRKSACELNYLQRRSKSLTMRPITAQIYQKKKLPWYISVIQEKDNLLFLLNKELQRLLELEVQSQKKNEEILVLREEMEALKRQLKYLLKSKIWEMSVSPGLPEDSRSPSLNEDQMLLPCQKDTLKHRVSPEALRGQLEVLSAHLSFLQEGLLEPPATPRPLNLLQIIIAEEEKVEELPLDWKEGCTALPSLTFISQVQEDSVLAEKIKDLEGDQEEEDLVGTTKGAEGEGEGKEGAVQEGMDEDEEEEEEEDEKEVVEEERDEGEDIQRRIYSMDDSFEDELMARLEEYEQVVEEIQCDLEITRNRYSLATGTITSLQRQVDFQESQLRKLNTEKEILQKELKERKNQLQAMSDKFSNLREGKKHEEMMGLIEKDNLLLRQQVMDLEKALMERDHVISQYDTKVQQLQAQVNLDQNHLQRGKQLQEDLQDKMELTQQAELQARVTLESTYSRLERLRNKIIQATFNCMGVKSMATEISDNDILEALQRVISERTDYYNQLKLKGVKVPPLNQSDSMFSSSSKSKKLSPK